MPWDVLALRYATAELAGDHLVLGGDPHDQMGRLDYFVWLLRDGRRTVLVDTGFDAEEGSRRNRTLLRHPVEALDSVGVRADEIEDVVITHMHFDHAGNLDAFPNARFHLQDREMSFATGRCMCHAQMRRPFSVEHVVRAVRLVYAERVVFHDGDYALFPGLDVHLIGGHSLGLQVLVAQGPERPVVVASDAAHLAAFVTGKQVFPAFGNYAEVLEGYRRLQELAGETGVILPGHDPNVLADWPRVEGLGEVVRIA